MKATLIQINENLPHPPELCWYAKYAGQQVWAIPKLHTPFRSQWLILDGQHMLLARGLLPQEDVTVLREGYVELRLVEIPPDVGPSPDPRIASECSREDPRGMSGQGGVSAAPGVMRQDACRPRAQGAGRDATAENHRMANASDRSRWTSLDYCAWVGAGKNRRERTLRLEEVPKPWRADVFTHVQCAHKMKAEERRRKRTGP